MKFSIAIPAYKAKFLKECIGSILCQTYKDFEVIIVDDASPENLKSVVDEFKDDRIRYYRNETNCGALNVVDNWNICLSYVTGDYIICMGDDDRLLPNCLESYKLLINEFPDLGVYHGWTEIINEDNEVVGFQEPRPLRESVASMMLCRFIYERLQFIGDWLFDVKRLRENGGFYKMPFAWGSDDLSAYIAAQKTGVANTQVPVFQYRVSSLTITNGGHIKEKIEALNSMNEVFYDILDKERPCTEAEVLLNKICHNSISDYLKKRRVRMLQKLFVSKGVFEVMWWLKNGKMLKVSKQQVIKAWLKSLIKQ